MDRNGNGHPKKPGALAALRKTGNISASCRAADISRTTFYNWRKNDEDFAAAVLVAMEDAVDVLEAEARRRALVGSDTLLIFLLKGAKPEVYRERHQVEHSGEVGFTLTQAMKKLEEEHVSRF